MFIYENRNYGWWTMFAKSQETRRFWLKGYLFLKFKIPTAWRLDLGKFYSWGYFLDSLYKLLMMDWVIRVPPSAGPTRMATAGTLQILLKFTKAHWKWLNLIPAGLKKAWFFLKNETLLLLKKSQILNNIPISVGQARSEETEDLLQLKVHFCLC